MKTRASSYRQCWRLSWQCSDEVPAAPCMSEKRSETLELAGALKTSASADGSMCWLDEACQWLTAWWPCRLLIARYAAIFTAASAAAAAAGADAEVSTHHGMSHVIVVEARYMARC